MTAPMESLSEEEFHQMQMLILELRTENYQLKDENKKLTVNCKKASENEIRLEREVTKQTKLRKAFTTLNKSKQAHEFEALLQQNEQAFILQNQTLAEELGKLQNAVKTLENENRQFKRQISLAPQDKAKEAEFRKLQAANVALKQSLSSLREELQLEKTQNSYSDANQASSEQPTDVALNGSSSSSETTENSAKDEASCDEEFPIKSNRMPTSNSVEDNKYYADLEVQVLTLQEEKRLLEFELDNAVKRHETKSAEIAEAMSALQTKLDQKQKSYNNVQKELAELQAFKKLAVESSSTAAIEIEKLKSELEQSSNDCQSLHKALQETHTIVEQQQSSLLYWQQQVDQKEIEYKDLKSNHAHKSEKLDSVMKDHDKCQMRLETLQKERDDVLARSEKTANAGEALLNKYTEMEKKCEQLQHELQQALNLAEKRNVMLEGTKQLELRLEEKDVELKRAQELAEKRKHIADQQSVESQELMAKLNEQMETLRSANEEKTRSVKESYDAKVKGLERSNKVQEEELIRLHHQERLKTRELDGLQQKINDLTSANTSLENSKGWFERALLDAEKLAEETKQSQSDSIEKLKAEHDQELEKARLVVNEKDESILELEQEVVDGKEEMKSRDEVIKRLKCDVKDEMQKQKLVEKKVHATLKDLKKQLISERKKNEMLQEKMKEQSNGTSNLDELLTVVNTSKPSSGGADGTSSISSFSFRDLINPGRTGVSGNERQGSPGHQRTSTSSPISHITTLTQNESSDLLTRVTELQNEKWDLEEKVRHLEMSAGAMADELLDKTAVVQRYIQHTRTDSVKRPPGDDNHSKSLKEKMRSFVTGTDGPVGIGNLHELNKKLTRMLEEEMTKNIALKKDMELMAGQLSSR